MRNLFPWLLATLFLFLTLYFYWQLRESDGRLAIADAKLAETQEQLEEQKALTDSMQTNLLPPDTMALVPPGGVAFVDQLGTLSEADVRRLQGKGLKNPEADLLNDLKRKQRQLIPAEGSMGGTMAIRDSRILNDRYAMAYYEDGHSGGYLILKYEVANGTINWRVVDNAKL